MDAHAWQRVKQIVQDALDRPVDERPAYIDVACQGDATLRQEVDDLLAISTKTANRLDVLPLLTSELAPGQRLDQYTILRPLGSGGMATVYLAEGEGQLVALKLLAPWALGEARHEYELLRSLDHPHIARIHDQAISETGQPYLVMEYVNGLPLDDYCHNTTLAERLALFATLCDAVAAIHAAGIVHRDIKPGNILVTADGILKLVDFGIAKLVTADAKTVTLTTLAKRPMTIAFASPEQVDGQETTFRTDIYSLGVLLHFLVTGRLPYRVKSIHSLTGAIIEQQIKKPSTQLGTQAAHSVPVMAPPAEKRYRLRHHLLRNLDPIILRALRKDPTERYDSARAMQAAVAGLLPKMDRLIVPWRAVMAAVVVVGLVIGNVWWERRPLEDPRRIYELSHSIPITKDMYYSDHLTTDFGSHIFNEEKLRVGGWGDWNAIFLVFDLPTETIQPDMVEINLRSTDSPSTGSTPVAMKLYAVNTPWDEDTGWEGELLTEFIRDLPAPDRADTTYRIAITNLYYQWQSGERPNYGVQLRAVSNNNEINDFYSSESNDPRNRVPSVGLYRLPEAPYSLRLSSRHKQYLTTTDAIMLSRTFTLSAWVRGIEKKPIGTIFSFCTNADNCALSWEITKRRGEYYSRLSFAKRMVAEATISLRDATWTHLGVTYNASTNEIQLYQGGLAQGDAEIVADGFTPISSVFTIGAQMKRGKPQRFLDGYIDDVRVWEIERTSEDIREHYLTELTVEDTGLIGYWKLNGDGKDSSRFRRDAVLHNDPMFAYYNGVLKENESATRVVDED